MKIIFLLFALIVFISFATTSNGLQCISCRFYTYNRTAEEGMRKDFACVLGPTIFPDIVTCTLENSEKIITPGNPQDKVFGCASRIGKNENIALVERKCAILDRKIVDDCITEDFQEKGETIRRKTCCCISNNCNSKTDF